MDDDIDTAAKPATEQDYYDFLGVARNVRVFAICFFFHIDRQHLTKFVDVC